MAIVYLGIGSNLGDRQDNCRKALQLLESSGVHVTKRSSMHETEPWGVKDQPRFINMAVEVETDMEPRKLLKLLKDIEKQLGKGSLTPPAKRWGPRTIDIDILLYDNLVIDEPDLKIPHPLVHERDFVLKPLSEIAPDARHPALGKTIKELRKAL